MNTRSCEQIDLCLPGVAFCEEKTSGAFPKAGDSPVEVALSHPEALEAPWIPRAASRSIYFCPGLHVALVLPSRTDIGCISEILCASRIPTNPSRNDRQASCLDHGSVEACSGTAALEACR